MKPNVLLSLVIILGVIALAALTIIVLQGIQKSQQAIPSRASEGWQHFAYTDPKFMYFTSPSCWFVVAANSGSYNQSGHNSPTMPNCGPTNTQSVKFATAGTGVQFDQIRVGYAQWGYGAKIPVTLDGSDLGQFDAKGSQTGPNRALKTWDSPTFSCGEHEVDLHVDTGGRSSADVLDLAFVEVHTCTPSSGGSGGNPTDTTCQGNVHASAKCFKCSDRNLPGQVNILDFSCFAKWYGQNVGKP